MLFQQISKLAEDTAHAKKKANLLINHILKRGTGQAEEDSLTVGDEEIPSGDIEAMVEAAESGLKGAHRWINSENKRISINDDEGEVTLNTITRSFVEDIEYGNETTRDVSVAALNVNNRTGRVYLHNAGHTVPFVVDKNADARTIKNLSKYLDKYANRTGATVNIKYVPIIHVDGRIKKILILDCYDIDDAA